MSSPIPALPRGRKLLVLAVLLPAAVAIHVYLFRLGGFWRVFAIGELVLGAFIVLAMRDARRLDEPPPPGAPPPRGSF